jgi:hypothetical protein
MGDLQQVRNKFITAAAALFLACVALLVYRLWPGTSHSIQQQQDAELRQKIALLNHEISIWKASDPAKIQQDLNRFYAENIATRGSEISKQLEKLLQDTGVTAQSIVYPAVTDKPPLPGVQFVKAETVVTGDYAKIAKFIHAMEQDKMLFLIDKVSLVGQQEHGSVSLQITFTTFLREAGPAKGRS